MPTNIFESTANGFAGRARHFGIDEQIVLVAIDPGDAENAPDYRVHIGDDDGPEAGAGWKRTGERAGEFIAVLIDDPALPQPIRANLFRDDDAGSSWSLHWSRPKPREDRD